MTERFDRVLVLLMERLDQHPWRRHYWSSKALSTRGDWYRVCRLPGCRAVKFGRSLED